MAIKGDFTSVMTFGIFREESSVVSPAVGDVEESVEYGESGNEFTGTFAVPAESDVQDGVGYGEDGTEFEGTLIGGGSYDPPYTDQDLSHSPAHILSRYLIGQSKLVDPDDSGDWPVYVGALPDGGNVKGNVVAAMDTTAVKDGRAMGGSPLFHFGVQLMVRCTDYNIGYAKAADLAMDMAGVQNTQIDVDSSSYVLHNISQPSGVLVLGQEQGTKRRYLFSVNFLATIREV